MAQVGLVAPDLQGLDALIAESAAQGFDFLKRIPKLVAEDARYLDADGSFVLGAYDGGVLVGIGGVTPDPYLREPGLGRVRHVYVAQRHRRSGIGRELIGGLEARAAAAYRRLRLRAVTAEAAAFYESLGYHRIADEKATHAKALVQPLGPTT
ncbi:MAG TPA: GNAT family N-acetyltransferase [Gemmatimonadaceae bacterium]|nr:GNAT family N-acetyltransferase [Gemmatimonadaceae bacterium]